MGSFVKLDDGILDSSLWADGDSTRLFITALLLAKPERFDKPIEQIAIRGFDKTGFVAPPGWYGFIPASSSGIIRRALLDAEQGMKALETLCSADVESRSCEFEGRRLARVSDGYVVLNFMKYRDKDYTAAERQKRLRERKKALESSGVTPNVPEQAPKKDTVMTVTRDNRDVTRNITQSESESESDKTPGKPKPLSPIGKDKSGNEDFSPSEVAQAVIHEAQAGGRYALASLTDIAKGLMASGADADAARDKMLSRWNEYKQAAGKLKYTVGSIEKFFTSGLWDNPDAWPWQDGKQPAPKSKAKVIG